MKLSKRLKAICDLIPQNSEVIDVGADHALTDIYLIKYKNCKCLATDISEKALEGAKRNAKKYKVHLSTLVTNGLNNINVKNEIIIISGMGTHTIEKILNKKITNDIIIGSHTDIPSIRRFMYKKGYHIKKEIAIYEKHYYVISYYEYGKTKKIDFIVSPFLINNIPYMKKELKYYQMKYQNEKQIIKKLNYKIIIKKIKHFTK